MRTIRVRLTEAEDKKKEPSLEDQGFHGNGYYIIDRETEDIVYGPYNLDDVNAKFKEEDLDPLKFNIILVSKD